MTRRNIPREGEVRIPSGCAIAGIMDRSGARHDGGDILRSIALIPYYVREPRGAGGHRGLFGALLPVREAGAHSHRGAPGHQEPAGHLALLHGAPPNAPGRERAGRGRVHHAARLPHQREDRGRLRGLIGQGHGRVQGRGLSGGHRRVLPHRPGRPTDAFPPTPPAGGAARTPSRC